MNTQMNALGRLFMPWLLHFFTEPRGEADAIPPAPASGPIPPKDANTAKLDGFRSRFPAVHRTSDGHLVRSRAEMLIDNMINRRLFRACRLMMLTRPRR